MRTAFRNTSFAFFLIVFLAAACSKPATRTTSQRNLADIYNPARSSVHPDFFIQHVNDSGSVLYVRVYPTELLFNQANEAGKSLAKLKIFLELKEINPDFEGGIFIDSISITRTLNKDEVRNSFFSGLPLKARLGKKYSVKVEVSDMVRNTTSQSILIADKTSPYSDQNFKVLSAKTGYPSFTRYFGPDEKFRLQFNQLGFDSIFVDYYSLDRTLPRPAFSSAPEIPMKSYPDTSFIFTYSDTIDYELPVQGIFHFRMSNEFREGLTLYNFGEYFPVVKSVDDLLGPLVYLTSSAEFRDIRMETNRKLAIDNFWLKLNSDLASSRELIRVYYNRVFYANLYFSSYKEGWKTDRGMIYIIFGPPRILEKSTDVEKWTYFSKKGGNTAIFEFKRNENQFTNLDYQLIRSANSSAFWREAIDSWRRGKVYSIDF
jgi:GWxTD domain-containing protein